MAIDLNADLGEGVTDDDRLLELVTSANLACGFHAGDEATMRRVCDVAAVRGVVIGAQVSYLDRENFGRRHLDVHEDVLSSWVAEQVGLLEKIAAAAGVHVAYVKPHGALYNAVVHHEAQAAAVVEAVRRVDPTLPLLGLAGSELLRLAAAAGLPTVIEAFADRGYAPDGRLVPRSQPGAVLHDPDQVASRVVRMVVEGTVEAVDGSTLRVAAQSICLHGDSPGAVSMAVAVRRALESAGLRLAPFVRES